MADSPLLLLAPPAVQPQSATLQPVQAGWLARLEPDLTETDTGAAWPPARPSGRQQKVVAGRLAADWAETGGSDVIEGPSTNSHA